MKKTGVSRLWVIVAIIIGIMLALSFASLRKERAYRD